MFKGEGMKKIPFGAMFTVLVIMSTLSLNVKPAKGIWTGTIYIRANGEVDPVTAPISILNNITYVFTDDVVGSLIVERGGIVIDGNGHTLQGAEAENGIILKAKNTEVRNFIITGFRDGISINAKLNLIHDNTLLNNYYGISTSSSSNKIYNNKLIKNNRGVYIGSSSNYIYSNIVKENDIGIYLISDASGTRIFGNIIQMNNVGILNYADVTIYHNVFINNVNHADLGGSPVLDNGYPSGGNYWDNYAGKDANNDAIGDSPYAVGRFQDRYPLIAPLKMFYAGTWEGIDYYVEIISNSDLSGFCFCEKDKFISFNVTGITGSKGFCRVTIPKDLLWTIDSWKVTINGQTINYSIIPSPTDTYLYFNYLHSTKRVTIQGTHAIPEFSSTTILTIFMLMTTVLVVLTRSRRLKHRR
jgi:parallel beta-helix repeat protein